MDNAHNIFLESLTFEYEYYKKMSFDEFPSLQDFFEHRLDKTIHTFDTSFYGFLDYSYNYYCEILRKCENAKSKEETKNIRTKSHIWIGDYWLQDIFAKMYWVIQDAVYYYISKQDPQLHQINMMFIDFFSKRKKPSPFDQMHKSIFNYHLTPSSQYFRDMLLGYDEKYIAEIEFSPIFSMFLYPLTLTKYGREYLLQIINMFGESLQEFYDERGISLLKYYFQKYKIRNLNRMLKLKQHIKLLTQKAENKFRESKNIPKIGENWIEETRLYNRIKEDFPDLLVVQHGRPRFLGKQHYDIWIPKIKIAIEYQGEQHYRPIEFFGGEKNYNNQLERDKRKYQLSNENNINLIYVNEGYNYKLLFDKIKNKF